MIEKLKRLDVILCLLVLLSLNSIRDINIAQAIVALGVFGMVAYNRWMEHIKKPDLIAELKQEVTTELSQLRSDLEHTRNNVSGLAVKNVAKETQPIKRFF